MGNNEFYTFEKWLIRFKHKKSPLGDLANFFIDTGCYTIEQSFDSCKPGDEITKVYREARKNYMFELASLLSNELVLFIDNIVHERELDDDFDDDHSASIMESICDLKNKLDDIKVFI